MRTFTVLLLLLCTSLLAAQEETVLQGKILGYDKKPMILAHVHVIKAPNPKPVVQVQAGSNGSFELRTKETGLLVVEFTGVHHMALDLPLFIEKPTKVDLTVALVTYSYVDDMKDVKIMTDLTDFNFNKAEPMQRQGDGTFVKEVQTAKEKLKYQIFGAEKTGRSINGTQSESFEFDDGGDYRSIVTPKDGKVRIVFDTKKLVRSNAEESVTFGDPTSAVAKIAMIQMEMNKRAQPWSEAINAYVKAGNDYKSFKYDWSAVQASIMKKLNSEKDPHVQQALLLSYVDTKFRNAEEADPAMGVRALKEIPPDSKLWMLPTLQLMKAAGDLAGNQALYEEYLGRFLEKNPDVTLKTNLLMNALMSAKMQGDERGLKLYYDLAMKHMGETPFGKMVKERFSPTIVIAVGKPVPAFKVKALEDTTKVFTNATFRGKVYLMDFWATWCGPCVGEMENLHKAYEKFKSKKFEILSLSLDQRPDDVKRFRGDKWKMPWLHTFVTNNKQVTDAFEVVAIPRPILVDGSGTIVAMDTDLRGENLEKTLAKFLGDAR